MDRSRADLGPDLHHRRIDDLVVRRPLLRRPLMLMKRRLCLTPELESYDGVQLTVLLECLAGRLLRSEYLVIGP
jgi:hypothetical protein